MDFRHEWKHEISFSDIVVLRGRLRAVMKPDENALEGKYYIRSLYFDNIYDKALRDKLDGVSCREKFRMRYYNGDTSFIRLEKKSKLKSLCSKESVNLTAAEAQRIVNGDYDFMTFNQRALFKAYVRGTSA